MGDTEFLSFVYPYGGNGDYGDNWRNNIIKEANRTGIPIAGYIVCVMRGDYRLIRAVSDEGFPFNNHRLRLNEDYSQGILEQFGTRKFCNGYESGLGVLEKISHALWYSETRKLVGSSYTKYLQNPSEKHIYNYIDALGRHLEVLVYLAQYSQIPDVFGNIISDYIDQLVELKQDISSSSKWNDKNFVLSRLDGEVTFLSMEISIKVDEETRGIINGLRSYSERNLPKSHDIGEIPMIQDLIKKEFDGTDGALGMFEKGRICALETYIVFAKQVDRYTGLMGVLRYGLEQVSKPFGLA